MHVVKHIKSRSGSEERKRHRNINLRVGFFFAERIFNGFFIFEPPDVLFFFVVGESAQKNPPGKTPAKSSKFYTTKIPDTFLQRGRANKSFWPVTPVRREFPGRVSRGAKFDVLSSERKQYKQFYPGSRSGGSETGVTDKSFMWKSLTCLFCSLSRPGQKIAGSRACLRKCGVFFLSEFGVFSSRGEV